MSGAQLALAPRQRHDVAEIRARIAGRRVIASVSGGRDSAAASLYLRELGIDHDRVFMDTGWEHPATYDYLRGELTRVLGPIREIKNEQFDFVGLVKHKGLFPSRVMRFCTTELKVRPMAQFVAALIEEGEDPVNVVGIRRAESEARSRMAEWDHGDSIDCDVWRPLVEWSVAEVESIIARHGLGRNPLYKLGASRVGCWPCIHARKAEIALVARIDPERVRLLNELEAELTTAARERARDAGEELEWVRTLFSYKRPDGSHTPLPMWQAVQWAESARGEWQPPNVGDGCMRHGMCDTSGEEAPRPFALTASGEVSPVLGEPQASGVARTAETKGEG